jgi:hypothetical protein
MDKDLLEYLDRHFSSLDKRVFLVDERLSTMDRHSLALDQQLSALRERFGALEDLRGEMGFVVEVVNNLAERFVKLGDDISQRIRTLESYTRYCYIHLEHRVGKLEATGKTTYPTRTLEPPAGADSSGSGSEALDRPQANTASP